MDQHLPLHAVPDGGLRQQQGFSDARNVQHHVHTLRQGIHIGGVRQVAAAVFRLRQQLPHRGGPLQRMHGKAQGVWLPQTAFGNQPGQHQAGFSGDAGDKQRFHFAAVSFSFCSSSVPVPPSTTPSCRSTAPMVPKKHLQSKAKLRRFTYSPS